MSCTISIRSASNDAANSPLANNVIAMAAALRKATQSGRLPAGPALDITFMLPGKLEKPDFAGMRMGGYTSGENTLYFERAVPDALLYSAEASEFVKVVLEDAIDNAAEYFAGEGSSFDRVAWRKALAQL